MNHRKGAVHLLLVLSIVVIAILAFALIPFIKDIEGLNIIHLKDKDSPTVTVREGGCKVDIALSESKYHFVNELQLELNSKYDVDFVFNGEQKTDKYYSCEVTTCYVDQIACGARDTGATQADIDWAASLSGKRLPSACTGNYKATLFVNELTDINKNYWKECGGRFNVIWTCTYDGDECLPVNSDPVIPDPVVDDGDVSGDGDDTGQNGDAPTIEQSWIERLILWLRSLFD